MQGAEDQKLHREQLAQLEQDYLHGTDRRAQSGFQLDEAAWQRLRRPVSAAIQSSGALLDIGCANGLLMQSVVDWAQEDGHTIDPYGLEISAKLAELARQQQPAWRDRIFTGDGLSWNPPRRFDFVRTELLYVTSQDRERYVRRLLETFVEPGGRLLLCSYGSSRREGRRAEKLEEEVRAWGHVIDASHEAVCPDHGFVITQVLSLVAT